MKKFAVFAMPEPSKVFVDFVVKLGQLETDCCAMGVKNAKKKIELAWKEGQKTYKTADQIIGEIRDSAARGEL